MEWSNSRELLAVAGTVQNNTNQSEVQGTHVYENVLKFFTESGTLLYQIRIPNSASPVSALTWGHNDKRLFIATGTQVHIAWVSRRVATLQLLCRLQIQASVGSESLLPLLPLPARIKSIIGYLFAQTIRCCVPDIKSLREFVSRPPMCSTRLHCTMIRHDDDSNLSSGTCYTLYLEYLGGLVPLLKGKRTSKIRPEFVIFDPQVNDPSIFFPCTSESKSSSASSQSTTTGNSGRTDSSDSDYDERGRNSPRTPRKRKTRQKRQSQHNGERPASNLANEPDSVDELAYVDTLPEEIKLVEVTSNIWGTKFKIHGLAKTVPANLGQVTYKTSLLHLQPRQMTLVITELRDDFPPGPDPNFNPNLFSEDEDESMSSTNGQTIRNLHTAQPITIASGTILEEHGSANTVSLCQRRLNDSALLVAPMSPRPNRLTSHRQKNMLNGTLSTSTGIGMSPLARAESYDDDSSNESPDRVNQPVSVLVSLHTPLTAGPNSSMALFNGASSSNNKLSRPKNITTCTPGARSGPGPGYSSFKNNYSSRSSSNSSCQSRHAISPLYCDGSLPTLQSPKNAVAPTDVIFERPAVAATGQTTLMSYSSNADYANNVVQVKNALMPESMRATNSHVNPVPLNLNLNLERMDAKVRSTLSTATSTANSVTSSTASAAPKRREILYIDEETQSPTQQGAMAQTPVELRMKRTATVVSIAPTLPDVITRSCSVGYLDSVTITPSDEALTALRRDAPHKRLILIDNRKQRKKRNPHEELRKPRLQRAGKSKSLDSCDLLVPQINSLQTNKKDEHITQKVKEMSENVNISCFRCHSNMNTPEICQRCHTSSNKNSIAEETENLPNKINLADNLNKQVESAQALRKPNDTQGAVKSRFDVITSFTDSPLFTRKHRFGSGRNKELVSKSGTKTETSTPILGRKHELSFNLVRQLAEVRWRRREQAAQSTTIAQTAENTQTPALACEPISCNGHTVEATPVEAKTSVSLHTQALTTLENIISRLRDLDEGRLTPPSTPQRLPRSSPASPAASKKNKRQQSNSPIRHILNSPLLNRRQRKKQQNIVESSDDEANNTNGSGEESCGGSVGIIGNKQYRDLETFQKAQLRQKLKRGKIEPNGTSSSSNTAPIRREFVMHNKAPMWNEMSQVYQLDFGGRVTQESAKNFQIEFRGKQVMQFGRIDGNAYTLDFQYPFSALQAFAVALANVTQRLK